MICSTGLRLSGKIYSVTRMVGGSSYPIEQSRSAQVGSNTTVKKQVAYVYLNNEKKSIHLSGLGFEKNKKSCSNISVAGWVC